MLTIFTKRLILDAWLGPESVPVDWCITAIKIYTKVCIDGRQVRWNHFSQPFPFEVWAISWPLKELSKVSVLYCSQGYLFGKLFANDYQCICSKVYF